MKYVAILICSLVVTTAGWAFWWEPASLEVRHYDLKIDHWPVAAGSLRIAVLADLHTGSPHHGLEMLERIVVETNAHAPDLILLAGDFVIHEVTGGHFVSPEDSARVLGGLSAKYGVHAVLGNHDWWLDRDRVDDALSGVGISIIPVRFRVPPEISILEIGGV